MRQLTAALKASVWTSLATPCPGMGSRRPSGQRAQATTVPTIEYTLRRPAHAAARAVRASLPAPDAHRTRS
jgi:hypothetical protein